MSDLDWINDKLHEIIGISEAHLTNYVRAIGIIIYLIDIIILFIVDLKSF